MYSLIFRFFLRQSASPQTRVFLLYSHKRMRPNVQIKLPIQKSPLFGSELCVNAHMIGTNLFNKGGPLHEKKPFASISTRKCALRCLCIALLPCSSCGWSETWDWVLHRHFDSLPLPLYGPIRIRRKVRPFCLPWTPCGRPVPPILWTPRQRSSGDSDEYGGRISGWGACCRCTLSGRGNHAQRGRPYALLLCQFRACICPQCGGNGPSSQSTGGGNSSSVPALRFPTAGRLVQHWRFTQTAGPGHSLKKIGYRASLDRFCFRCSPFHALYVLFCDSVRCFTRSFAGICHLSHGIHASFYLAGSDWRMQRCGAAKPSSVDSLLHNWMGRHLCTFSNSFLKSSRICSGNSPLASACSVHQLSCALAFSN